MVSLFLSPQGRIASGPYWLGVIVLVVIGCALSAANIYGPSNLQLVWTIVNLVLIYPQVCVYGKRLHDAGKSAWWFLAIIAIYIVVVFVVGIALSAPYFGQMAEVAQDQAAMAALQVQIQEAIYLPATVVSIVVWLIISFVVGNLRSDPGENKYGPPPAAKAAGPV